MFEIELSGQNEIHEQHISVLHISVLLKLENGDLRI